MTEYQQMCFYQELVELCNKYGIERLWGWDDETLNTDMKDKSKRGPVFDPIDLRGAK